MRTELENTTKPAIADDALLSTVIFYALINHENKFFRNKGYSGYGDNWVDNISKARIYPKIGSAKAQITFWGKNYPKFPVPRLVEITGNITKIIEQAERIKDVINKEEEFKKKQELNNARIEYEESKRKYESLL